AHLRLAQFDVNRARRALREICGGGALTTGSCRQGRRTLAYMDRKQLDRTARAAQPPPQIHLAPAEDLVGVDAMPPRDRRPRCTFDQRRFDDPLLLVDGAVLPL